MAITVKDCLNNINPPVNLGYIKLFRFSMGCEGTETGMDTLTSKEFVNLQTVEAQAYFKIGEYWYIIAKG